MIEAFKDENALKLPEMITLATFANLSQKQRSLVIRQHLELLKEL